MNVTIYAFVLTFLAGLSATFGALLILFVKQKNDLVVIISLSLAGGVMITLSIIDLIPSALKLLNTTFMPTPSLLMCMIFIVVGIILSMLIDKYLPDGGEFNKKHLYNIGIISMFAIMLHNIPEGIATFIATKTNFKLGLNMAIAIALHNIPEGITIAVPIYYATNKRSRAVLYTLISGLSESLGAVLAYLFLSFFLNNTIMALLLAIISGIMLHISIYELIPTSLGYKRGAAAILSMIAGSILITISHILI
jgi:ZIP family zinc transporter